jgi:hypothetical protein
MVSSAELYDPALRARAEQEKSLHKSLTPQYALVDVLSAYDRVLACFQDGMIGVYDLWIYKGQVGYTLQSHTPIGAWVFDTRGWEIE